MGEQVGRTRYTLLLGAVGNFGKAESDVWADTLVEAIEAAQEEYPGMFVHTAWATEGAGADQHRTEEELEAWMQAHPRKNGGTHGNSDATDDEE